MHSSIPLRLGCLCVFVYYSALVQQCHVSMYSDDLCGAVCRDTRIQP